MVSPGDSVGEDTGEPRPAAAVEVVRTLTVPEEPRDFRRVAVSRFPRRATHGYLSAGVTAGDLDGDFVPELLVADRNELLMWRSDGQGGLIGPEVVYASARDDFAFGVWLWDFDRDGRDDVIWPGWNGLRVLRNEGGLRLTPVDDTWGLRRRRDVPTTFNFTDLDGDGLVDLFVGYVARNFISAIVGNETYTHELEDEIYLQGRDGRFQPLEMPRRTREEGWGWYTLHAIPFQGGLLALADAGVPGSHQSALYRLGADGRLTARWMEDVLGYVHAPMGGFCDWVEPPAYSCYVSDLTIPHVYKDEGEGFFRDLSKGTEERYFSWSVMPDDIDLDDDLDVVLTLGQPPLEIYWDGLRDATNAGLVVYPQRASDFDREKLLTAHLVGATLVDLDGNGTREIVVREVNATRYAPTQPMDAALHVYGVRNTTPRVSVLLDATCLDAVVTYGATRRTFAPYSNTGSFGHGTFALAFPYHPGEQLVVSHPVRGDVVFAPEENAKTAVTCPPPPAR